MSDTSFIPAQPNKLYKLLFAWYFRRRLRSTFHQVMISGRKLLNSYLPSDPNTKEQIPLICYCSHSGWWDAILAIDMSLKEYGFDGYGLMEYRQLERYRFFSKLGLFSVIREDPRSALYSLNYGAELLRNSRRVLWMFPQGTIVHQDKRPLGFEPGIGMLVKKLGKVALAPVAFRYDYQREEGAEIRISIGVPEIFEWNKESSINAITEQCELTMQTMMSAQHHQAINSLYDGYELYLSGKKSIEKNYDSLRGRD
jgi:chlorobactene lauroyltransferase